MLLLCKVADSLPSALNRSVEAIEALQEIGAVKGPRREGVNDLFDLGGDDIAAREVWVAEHRAENPLGQKMLNEHLLDRCGREVWVDRRATFCEKTGKGRGEPTTALPFLLNFLRQPTPDRRHLALELRDRLFPLGDLRRTV